jgi:hypothetical protein
VPTGRQPARVDVEGARCSDGCVGDQEELLQPKRPRLPRRIRLAALLLAVVAIAAGIAIRVWPRSTHPSVAAPPGTTSVPSAISPPTPETTTPPPWPTAPGACNSDAELSIVSSRPASEHTGIRVLLGGNRLRTVDFDTARITAMSQVRLRPDEFVTGLIASSQTYAFTTVCMTGQSRLLRIDADGSASAVTLPDSMAAALADDGHMWAVAAPKNPNASAYLIPLAGGRRVRLPVGFFPDAITRGVLVGNVATAEPTTGSLLLVDATTGRVRANLGTGWPLAVGGGLVVWTKGCDPPSDKPCTFHRTSVTGGPTASYRLPRPAFDGVISPDNRLIALTLERPAPDTRFEGHPIPPSDIAVLHLDTGRLEIVPGIEVPAKIFPGRAFSADDRWLVIALDAGPKTRLLAWRSGLTQPYESKPIAGPTMEAPPVLVLLTHADR